MNHLTYIWNITPKEGSISPNAILSRTILKENYPEVKSLKIWGCPVYILDYKVASGQKLPKWDVKSRRGVYLGVSPSQTKQVEEKNAEVVGLLL